MRSFKYVLAAAAIALAAPIAAAQAQTGSPILVIDSNRILSQSAAGQDMQTKLQAIQDQMNQELTPEANAVRAEQQAIAQALQGLDAQQAQQRLQSDAALRQRVEALDARAQALQQRQLESQTLLELTERRARDAFNRAVGPAVQAVMNARAASVVLDRAVVVTLTPAADATQDVLTRLNAEVTQIPVARVTAEEVRAAIAAAQQGQGGAPTGGN